MILITYVLVSIIRKIMRAATTKRKLQWNWGTYASKITLRVNPLHLRLIVNTKHKLLHNCGANP